MRKHFIEVCQHITLEPILRLVCKVDYFRDLDILAEQTIVDVFERTLEFLFPLFPKELSLIKLNLLVSLCLH